MNYETNNKLPTEMPSSASSPAVIVKKDKDKSYSLLSKSGYKFWVLSAILLLASWSMFTGSLSLKWSSPDITRLSDDADFPVHDDLDILEVEERKQVVMRTWDAYAHGKSVRLPRFWLEAFAAAYEYLISDMPGVRDVAVSEIAKMSMHSINVDPVPVQSRSNKSSKKNSKIVEGSKKVTDGTS